MTQMPVQKAPCHHQYIGHSTYLRRRAGWYVHDVDVRTPFWEHTPPSPNTSRQEFKG